MNRLDKLINAIESFYKKASTQFKYAQYAENFDDELYIDLGIAAHDVANLTSNKKGEIILSNLVDELNLLRTLYRYSIENNKGFNILYEKARQLKEVNTDLNTLSDYGQKGRDIVEILRGSDRFDGLTDEIMNKATELAGSKQLVLSPDDPQTIKEIDSIIRGHRNDQMENDIRKEIGTGFATPEAEDEGPDYYAPGVPANVGTPAAKGLEVSEKGKASGWSGINDRSYKDWSQYYKEQIDLYSELKSKQKNKSRYDEVIQLFNQIYLICNKLSKLEESATPLPEDQLIKDKRASIRLIKDLRDPKKIKKIPNAKPISIKDMKERLDKVYAEIEKLNELKTKRELESDDPIYKEISRLKAELKELRDKVDNGRWILRKDKFEYEKDKLSKQIAAETNPMKIKLIEYKIKLIDSDLEILNSKGSYIRNAQREKDAIKEAIRYIENSASINSDYLSKLDNKIMEMGKLKTTYKRHADKGTIEGDVNFCQQTMTAFFTDVKGVDNLCELAWEHVAVKSDAYLNLIAEKKKLLSMREPLSSRLKALKWSKNAKDENEKIIIKNQLKEIDNLLIKWNKDLVKIIRATLSNNELVNQIIKRFDTGGIGRHSEPKSEYMRVLRDIKKMAAESIFDLQDDISRQKIYDIAIRLKTVRDSMNLPGLESSSKFKSIKEIIDKLIKDFEMRLR
jgi:hypothetical protein